MLETNCSPNPEEHPVMSQTRGDMAVAFSLIWMSGRKCREFEMPLLLR